jgi:hypothetical protein
MIRLHHPENPPFQTRQNKPFFVIFKTFETGRSVCTWDSPHLKMAWKQRSARERNDLCKTFGLNTVCIRTLRVELPTSCLKSLMIEPGIHKRRKH